MNDRFFADALDSVVVRNGVAHLIFAARDIHLLQNESISPDEQPVKHCISMPVPAMVQMLQLMDRLRAEEWISTALKSMESIQTANLNQEN